MSSWFLYLYFNAFLQKIRELISALDQRKDESIERTFKGVARHFREVFSELVQGGHGHLVMMKKKVS
jgi:structural maintenance of chromosome 3 (chondroitin sulfate proteoglycan 6)